MADDKPQTPVSATAKETTPSRWKWFGDNIAVIGGIVGLLAGLVTLPKSMVDTYEAVHAAPKLSIHAGAPVFVTYDPKQQTLSLSWQLLLVNDGNASEVIDSATAYLEGVYGSITNRVAFDKSEIEFKDAGAKIDSGIALKKDGDSRSITFEVTTNVTPQLHAIFSQPDTVHFEFVLSLIGKKINYWATRKFFFTKHTVDTLFPPDVSSPTTIQLQ
jgi:hypothetical protein